MSEFDRKKWDEKYRLGPSDAVAAVPQWLAEHLAWLPSGRAIDVACGLGGAAISLADNGWTVAAVDVSSVGLARAASAAGHRSVLVDWIAADLDNFEFPFQAYDVITMFNYLDRGRLPGQIVRTLRPGGMLVAETFSVEQLGRPDNHIKNPDHVLGRGELLTMFAGLRVRCYRDVMLPDRSVASLIAEKPRG